MPARAQRGTPVTDKQIQVLVGIITAFWGSTLTISFLFGGALVLVPVAVFWGVLYATVLPVTVKSALVQWLSLVTILMVSLSMDEGPSLLALFASLLFGTMGMLLWMGMPLAMAQYLREGRRSS